MNRLLLISLLAAPAGAATRVVVETGTECRHLWRSNGNTISMTSCTLSEYANLSGKPIRTGFTWVRTELYGAYNTPQKVIGDGDAIDVGGAVQTLLNGKIFNLPEAFVANGRVQSNRTYPDVEITPQGDIVEKASVSSTAIRPR